MLKKPSDKFIMSRLTEAGELVGRAPGEGRVFKVVLISEGLGNRKNMNYYGPEAIDSAPAAFEGKPCFLNHPAADDEKNIPERRVEDKCGYFKNLQVVVMEGKRACVGELHFDLSETGRMGMTKAMTALHYQREFPGSEQEYVGLSVNADGETQRRTVPIEGRKVEVSYVARFTQGASVDLVTAAARGGKILACIESMAGAVTPQKETRTMIIETLTSALSQLKEAQGSKDLEASKKILGKSQEALEALLESAKAAAVEAEEALEAKKKEDEASESEAKVKAAKMKAAKKKEDEAKEGKDDGDADDEKMAKMKKEKKEAMVAAVEGLLKEANLGKDEVNFDVMVAGTLAEAKAEIGRVGKMQEAVAKKLLQKIGVSAANLPKLHESAAERTAAGTRNQHLFANCKGGN